MREYALLDMAHRKLSRENKELKAKHTKVCYKNKDLKNKTESAAKEMNILSVALRSCNERSEA